MVRAVALFYVASLASLFTACGQQQDPTIIRIEEASGSTSAIPRIVPGSGATPSESASAEGMEAMGADSAAPQEAAAPAKKDDPMKKPEDKAETPKSPDATKPPAGGTTAPVASNPSFFTFKTGKDGSFDRTAAIVGTWFGEDVLVCRVKNSSGALVTGTMVPSAQACFFDNNGTGYYATAYEYLAINADSKEKAKWALVSDLKIPSNAVATGTTNKGKPSYVCSVDFSDGSSLTGHAAEGYDGCIYSINADVYVAKSFYVIVK